MSVTHTTQPVARTSFRSPLSSKGFIDGAWWPASRDLDAELPGLIAAAAQIGADIRRVSYNKDWWGTASRRIVVAGRTVRLGGFQNQDALLIGLVDETRTFRRDILVIPPETEPAQADAAMRLAARSGGVERPAHLMEIAAGHSGR